MFFTDSCRGVVGQTAEVVAPAQADAYRGEVAFLEASRIGHVSVDSSGFPVAPPRLRRLGVLARGGVQVWMASHVDGEGGLDDVFHPKRGRGGA